MNKEGNIRAMDLQFFAEDSADTGVTESEIADQTSETEASTESVEQTEDTSVKEESTDPHFQTAEANSAFASLRRQAEAAQKQLRDIDAAYASQFGGYKNPETGEPIRSAKDYVEAMAAQERMQAREKLRENNIDPSILDRMIADSPAVRAAEAATAELNEIKAQQKLEQDIKEVLTLDPTLTSAEDLYKDPKLNEIIEKVGAGLSLVDAYKIVNFDRLTGAKGEAAKQAAINSVKAKNHLATGASLDVGDTGEDIPANMIEMYKESFPEKSMAELKALYNKALKARR